MVLTNLTKGGAAEARHGVWHGVVWHTHMAVCSSQVWFAPSRCGLLLVGTVGMLWMQSDNQPPFFHTSPLTLFARAHGHVTRVK